MLSTHERAGGGLWLGELSPRPDCCWSFSAPSAPGRPAGTPSLSATTAYWFTSSTSFANPAVTVARMITDTFAGIAPPPAFILAQLARRRRAFPCPCRLSEECCLVAFARAWRPRPLPRQPPHPIEGSFFITVKKPSCSSSASITPAVPRWPRRPSSPPWARAGSRSVPQVPSPRTTSTWLPSKPWPNSASTCSPDPRDPHHRGGGGIRRRHHLWAAATNARIPGQALRGLGPRRPGRPGHRSRPPDPRRDQVPHRGPDRVPQHRPRNDTR